MLFRDVASNENIYLHLLHNRLRVVRFSTKRRAFFFRTLSAKKDLLWIDCNSDYANDDSACRGATWRHLRKFKSPLRLSHRGTTESLKTS